jgi:spermidine synthase
VSRDALQRRLSLLVLGAGAGSLAIEISAARLLAPYFGSSTVVWANVIGLVLASLAAGYWLGGRLADRHPEPRLLGGLVAAAAVATTVIPFAARPLLDLAVRGLDAISAGTAVGSFAATLALFAPPTILLGMVGPFALRLAIATAAEAGTVGGRLYALSTAGSLAGTFLSALVGIPALGTRRTLLVTAVVLFASAALLLGRRWQVLTLGAALLVALPPGAVRADPAVLVERESAYQYVRVLEQPDGSRRLELNEGVVANSLWYPSSVLTGDEWDMFLVLPALLDRPTRSLLVLGNAGGTTARAFDALYPRVRVDGVELDPAVTAVARRFLGLGGLRNLHVFTADARVFVRRADRRWDIVAIDAYRQPYIPFQLATREFFSLVHERLVPGGVVGLNVARVPGDDALVRAIGATLRDVFPYVARWDALRLNTLLVASDRPLDRPVQARAAQRGVSLVRLYARDATPVAARGAILTDDHAPVEWIVDRMLLRFAAKGGEPGGPLLPTAP